MRKTVGLAIFILTAVMAVADDRVEHVIPSLTNDVTLTWEWLPEYLLDIQSGTQGSVTGTESGWHEAGTEISILAAADEHYRFTRWEGAPDGMSTNNPLEFTLDAPYTNIVATYSTVDYSLTVVSEYPEWGLGDIGNPQPGTGSYPALSTVTQAVDRIVVDPLNPGRRLRHKGARVE